MKGQLDLIFPAKEGILDIGDPSKGQYHKIQAKFLMGRSQ